MAECGLAVDHSTIARWFSRTRQFSTGGFDPRCAIPVGRGALMKTYVRVGRKLAYLYQAIDSAGNTIDFLLSPRRDVIAAKGFLQLALWQAGQFRPE